MAPRRLRAFLDDIQEAIERLRRLTAGKTIDTYRADGDLRWAVERGIEIVSEATRHTPPDFQANHPQIPWWQVADVGNRLRHGYHGIDPLIVWNIVEHELGELERVVTILLASLDDRTEE